MKIESYGKCTLCGGGTADVRTYRRDIDRKYEVGTGKRLANGMASGGHFQDIADLSDEFSIIETKIPKEWIGKSLIELNPRKKFGFNVIAEKVNGVYKNNIDADKPFGDQESIIVIGDNEKLLKVFKEG